jgi:hypothetical protein
MSRTGSVTTKRAERIIEVDEVGGVLLSFRSSGQSVPKQLCFPGGSTSMLPTRKLRGWNTPPESNFRTRKKVPLMSQHVRE